jgi:hypothetical protein
MANYRQIHVSIWKDEWFLELEPDEKLLFIYLFSNESASLSGLYKLALKVICFETCLEKAFVLKTLKKFEQADKVYYREGVVWVKNMAKYNKGSAKVELRVIADVNNVPDCELKRMYFESQKATNPPKPPVPEPPPPDDIPYEYDMDTVSIPYEYQSALMKTNEDNISSGDETESSNNSKPIPKKKSELVIKLEYLERVFADARGCAPPDWSKPRDAPGLQKTWRTPLRTILKKCNDDEEIAGGIVRQVVSKMMDDHLTFSMPTQILATAESMIIDNQSRGGRANGYTPA